ncbi:hypothetical protein, partial [Verrucomicrobium sp. BvORR106]|uniref:hypothetical protein n=1 Tax=Verrucomicrobium sp. BvORR106 TaxID=1403819 RepID=UPI002240F8D0
FRRKRERMLLELSRDLGLMRISMGYLLILIRTSSCNLQSNFAIACKILEVWDTKVAHLQNSQATPHPTFLTSSA